MNNMGSMAEMIEAAMKKKEGPKDSFTMNGGKASPVQRDEDREFVVYESPNGEQIKVYGNWNEYAIDRTPEGNDMISDDDFPIIRNEEGEYVMDEAAYEQMLVDREQESMPAEEEMMPEEESEEGEMKYGGKMMYAEGGKLSSDKPKPKPASPEKAYQLLKTEYENMLEEKRNSEKWTTKQNLQLGMIYDNMRRYRRIISEKENNANPASFMGGGYAPVKRNY